MTKREQWFMGLGFVIGAMVAAATLGGTVEAVSVALVLCVTTLVIECVDRLVRWVVRR